MIASAQVGGGRCGGPLAAIMSGDGLVPPSAKKIAAACVLVQFRQKLSVCKLHGAAGLRKARKKSGGFDSLHPLQWKILVSHGGLQKNYFGGRFSRVGRRGRIERHKANDRLPPAPHRTERADFPYSALRAHSSGRFPLRRGRQFIESIACVQLFRRVVRPEVVPAGVFAPEPAAEPILAVTLHPVLSLSRLIRCGSFSLRPACSSPSASNPASRRRC